jgi:hypothetical protein
MTKIRVFAKRPTPLEDLNIVNILDFSVPFDVDVMQQLDEEEPTLVQKVTFDPEEPMPEPTPPEPEPEPPTPDSEVLYDSTIHSKLHDGKVRIVEEEGSIKAGGLGVQCRASGKPKCVVNEDNTFSLVCGAGHGRFYFYVLNYDATLEIECAFWNQATGQDLSLKMRSRHNEGSAGATGGNTDNRFGGYGLSVDRAGFGAKREIFHNSHDQSESGKTPEKIETKKYFKIEFTVKDDGKEVKQTAAMNGKNFMNKVDKSPKPYMVDKSLYEKQSYLWVRQNIDSGSGEIRIKRLRILKA